MSEEGAQVLRGDQNNVHALGKELANSQTTDSALRIDTPGALLLQPGFGQWFEADKILGIAVSSEGAEAAADSSNTPERQSSVPRATGPGDEANPSTTSPIGSILSERTAAARSEDDQLQGSSLTVAPETVTKRSSRTSLVGKRNGSVASSKRSDRAHANLHATPVQPANKETQSSTRPEKKRGASRFLSFFVCCGSSHERDLDENPVPVKKSAKLQSNQTQTVKGKDVSAAESSTAESKHVSNEKIGGTPYAELKSAGEPKILEQQIPAATTTSTEPQKTDAENSNLATSSAEEPGVTHPAGEAEQAVDKRVDALVPTAIPIVGTSSEEQNPIDDRTPHQEKSDTDIKMKDASSTQPPTVEESKGTEEKTHDPTPPLPPPPPIAPPGPGRQDSSTSRQNNRTSVNQPNVPNEQQKWLLPPLRPEFKGKKCLVLDLDETLVHSSFKVREKMGNIFGSMN